jgi:hypothetical protein
MIQVLTTPPNVLWVKPIGDTKSAIDSYDFPATCSRARNVCRVDAASWAFSAPSEERNYSTESHRNVWPRRSLSYRARKLTPTVLKLSPVVRCPYAAWEPAHNGRARRACPLLHASIPEHRRRSHETAAAVLFMRLRGFIRRAPFELLGASQEDAIGPLLF